MIVLVCNSRRWYKICLQISVQNLYSHQVEVNAGKQPQEYILRWGNPCPILVEINARANPSVHN